MSRDFTALHPFMRMIGAEFAAECRKAGLNVKITDCVRTKEEQNGIDASRTGVRYPYSYHNWGLAFDICQDLASCPYPSDMSWWKKAGAIGKRLGLEWGGDWTCPVDRPHFQLNSYGDCNELIRKYHTPSAFFGHGDFKIRTPKLPISQVSGRKKILWLQIRLNCQGAGLALDGIYGTATVRAVKEFWRQRTGRACTGKTVNMNCIRMLAA